MEQTFSWLPVFMDFMIVGTILNICMLRAMRGHFNEDQYLGFEAAAWYWHFVDVYGYFCLLLFTWGEVGATFTKTGYFDLNNLKNIKSA